MDGRKLDRAVGALVGLAAGDALGAGYEFGPVPAGAIEMIGGGLAHWAPGEWTDDTQMAICIAEEAASGDIDVAAVGDRFLAWFGDDPKDVGLQTTAVLSGVDRGEELTGRAAAYFRRHPKHAAGNGSLMRTGPVALAHLDDRDAIAAAAAEISALTHADPLAVDACVLWTLAVADAVNSGEIQDLRHWLAWLPTERRDRWAGIIDAAEVEPAATFTPNGFVVTAFQAAWSSILDARSSDGPTHLRSALIAAVRVGNDTDTVAAIAGTLLGAAYGVSAVPLSWKALLHGWPGYTARDLVRLAVLSATGGEDDPSGWPGDKSLIQYYLEEFEQGPTAIPLADDPGVIIGNVAGLEGVDADVIVSLCRMGEPIGDEHHDVWLLDGEHSNAHLGFVLDDAADFIREQRDASKTVYVHCVRAESRTPTVGAAYLARLLGVSGNEALERIRRQLPGANPNPGFLAYLESVEGQEN